MATPRLEDGVGAAPVEDVAAAKSGAVAREARLLVTAAIEATVVNAASALSHGGSLPRSGSKLRMRIEASAKKEDGSRPLRDHLGGFDTIVVGETRPTSGYADFPIAAVRGGIERTRGRDGDTDEEREEDPEERGAQLGRKTSGGLGQPDPDNFVEGVDHSKSVVAFQDGQNGDMAMGRNEPKEGERDFFRSRNNDFFSFVKDNDGPAPSNDEFGWTVAEHLSELQERPRSLEQGAGFQRHRRLSRRQTLVVERTLVNELEVVRQEIHPAREGEAEREEESQLAMLHLTKEDLADLFEHDETGRDGFSMAQERGRIRSTRCLDSRDSRHAVDTMGAAEGSTGRSDGGVIHRRAPEGGSGRIRTSSAPWTNTEPGPDEALAAGARRRSMLIEASNAYAGHASKPSRMRRTSHSLGKSSAVTALARRSREEGTGEVLRAGVGRPGGTAADGTQIDQSDALLLGGGSELERSDREGEKPVGGREHNGLGDVIVSEEEGASVVGDGREGIRHRRRGPKGPGPVILNASQCEYAVVRECAIELGWHVCETKFGPHSDPLTKKERTTMENPHTTADAAYACTHEGMCNRLWNVMWHDRGNFEEHLKGLQSFQYYSHLPGLSFFARKAGLALLISRMHQEAPKEFHFFPETWVLPTELQEFRSEFGACRSDSVFIIKPDSGCQGKGIFLTNKVEEVAELPGKSVAQRYLTNPLLIDGYKFDLRLYVLVTSVEPMRIFLFNDGLVRMCTELYQAPRAGNLHNITMHLTNYSVNKASSNFTSDDTGESGFKRSLKWFRRWLDEHGHDSAAMWARLADVCVKTLLTVGPMLRKEHKAANPGFRLPPGGASREDGDKRGGPPASPATRPYSPPPFHASPTGPTCFTIVGVDLMIDDHLQPWIIEINHLPSFRTDTGMDYRIKKELVFNTLSLLDIKVGAREDWQMEMENLRRGRLLGLPRKNDGAQEATRSFGGGGSAGGAPPGQKKKNSTKRKGRTRIVNTKTPKRDRETFEQSEKGGFERVFPPSQTAPNSGARYAKVMRVAEAVFAKLSSYRSPAHSPRSASPPTSPLSRGNRGSALPLSAGVLQTPPPMSLPAPGDLTPVEETQVEEPPPASQLAAGASSTSQSSIGSEDESEQPVAPSAAALMTAARTSTPCGGDDLPGEGGGAAEGIAGGGIMMSNRSQPFWEKWQRSISSRGQHEASARHLPRGNEGASAPSQDRERSFGFVVGDAAGGDHRDGVHGAEADSDERPSAVEAPSPAAAVAGAESDREALENRSGGTVSTPPEKTKTFSSGSPLRRPVCRRHRHAHRSPPLCKRTASARKGRRSRSPGRRRKKLGAGTGPGGDRHWEKEAKRGRKMYKRASSCGVECVVKDRGSEGEDGTIREGGRGGRGAYDGGRGGTEDAANLEEERRSAVEVNHKCQQRYRLAPEHHQNSVGRSNATTTSRDAGGVVSSIQQRAVGYEGASGGIGARWGLPENCCLRPVVPQRQQQRSCDLQPHQDAEWATQAAPSSRSGIWPARSPVRPFSARSGSTTARSRWVAVPSTKPVPPWRSSGERTTGGASHTARDHGVALRATHHQGEQVVKPAGVGVVVTVPSSVCAPFGSNLETAAATVVAGEATHRIGTTWWSHRFTTLSSSPARHRGVTGTAASAWGQGGWNGGGSSGRWRPIASLNHPQSSGTTKLGAGDCPVASIAKPAAAAETLAHPTQALARPSTGPRSNRDASHGKAKPCERDSVGRGGKAVARPITPTVLAVSFFGGQQPPGPAVARGNSRDKTHPSTAVEGTASAPRPPPHHRHPKF